MNIIFNLFSLLIAKGRTNIDLRENLQLPPMGTPSKGSKFTTSNATTPTSQSHHHHHHNHKVSAINFCLLNYGFDKKTISSSLFL